MKKLLVLLLLIPVCIIARPKSDTELLLEDISDYIVDNMKYIENTEGLYTDSDFWTDTYWIYNYKSYSWTFDFERGKEYIFYAMTNKPNYKVKVCINGRCSKAGQRAKLRFRAKGKNKIWIKYLGEKPVLVVGYMTHLQKEYIDMPWHNK